MVDETRRNLIKAGVVAVVGSAIGFIAVKREKLMELLKPVDKVELLSAIDREYSVYAERAKKKEAELKRWCMEEAAKLCRERGEESVECVEAKRRCDAIQVKATGPRKGVRFAMAIDLNKCIGCRRCAYACVMENNQGRNLNIEWIKVLGVERKEFPEILGSQLDYEMAPLPDTVYIPISCMHCENPPCVMVCPVRATWKESDGIVVVDYDRCIGCRYCIAACPYGARYFNWAKPVVPVLELNPNMHILGNVPRVPHVVEKCTFCIQRTRDGGVPACVEVCPVGARVFGDLNDPNSPIRRVIERYGVYTLKSEAGTNPRLFYFFGPSKPVHKQEGRR